MSPFDRDQGGLPRDRRRGALPPKTASIQEDWTGANDAKAEALRRNKLQRRVRARGGELRHSVYGYAVIDAARTRVDDRNDLTLDDVESWLARG